MDPTAMRVDLRDSQTEKKTQYALLASLRQYLFSPFAHYEDTSDANGLVAKPPIRRPPRKKQWTTGAASLAVVVVSFLLLVMLVALPLAALHGPAACYIEVEPISSFRPDRYTFYADGVTDVLVGTPSGIYRYEPGDVLLGPVGHTGEVFAFHRDIANAGVLVGAANGLFRYAKGDLIKLAAGKISDVVALHDAPGGGVLVGTAQALFRYDAGGTFTQVFAADNKTGIDRIEWIFYDDGADVLIAKNRQFDDMKKNPGPNLTVFRYTASRTLMPMVVPLTGVIRAISGDGAGGLLLSDGAILLHRTPFNGGTDKIIATFPLQDLGIAIRRSRIVLHEDRAHGILIGWREGIYRYDEATMDATEQRRWPGGEVFAFHNDGTDGILIGAAKGLFRWSDGEVAEIGGEKPTLGVWRITEDGERGFLIGAARGVFYGFWQPLSGTVTLENQELLSGHKPDANPIEFKFRVSNDRCAPAFDQMRIQVVALEPGARWSDREKQARERAVGFEEDFQDGGVLLKASLPIPKPGDWMFKVISSVGGIEAPVGQPIRVTFREERSLKNILELVAAVLAAALALLQIAVFVAARFSSKAWRMATDKSWGSLIVYRLATLLLFHWLPAQLWILDLYVRRQRLALLDEKAEELYLPMSLLGSQGEIANSGMVRLAKGRHVWVQGNSGMGKTSLVRHLTLQHFTGAEATSFAIFRRDHYLVVRVDARRFAQLGDEGKREPAWVLSSMRAVLSSHGLNFENEYLLRKMLGGGVLAPVIDGLSEVGRALAVAAFADEFADAPMLVTSQEAGQDPFETWRLPDDIKEHVDELLRLYLGAVPGDVVAQRLKNSELLEAMQTGYDVRLVADLSYSNPRGVDLSFGRTDLYHKVMDAAWPEGLPERVRADQARLQAAAWKLCSERGPNVDKRRIIPDDDAPKDLLEALTIAGEQPGRHVRLVRRAGATFEFVHDQMNAFLAAVWLTGRPTVDEMRDMLSSSKVWDDTVEVQNTLWSFVVPLLDAAEQRKLCDRVRHEEKWHTLRYKLENALEKAGNSLEWIYVAIDERK